MNKQELIKKGYEIYEYENGDYSYIDKKGTAHLIRNGKEIAKGKSIYIFGNGDYAYIDETGKIHYVKGGVK